ncbi:DUF2271 domain-containing protein [Sphingomonas sp. SRS2]|uniref:DUF2271 domain-containing protein n=1 Tax=Sphingomonas sp. SRS2 TaxID=133190 RepID=UPI00061844CC|nr:DUF2271 domain-containing protein [Sphingomonas sp. SRS2]KKC25980.1 hypothetical protein WP12_11070 [Sphingomonas sp. SRS2]
MRYSPFVLLGGIAAVPASAASVSITIPTLKVAEYHKPYLAVWLEPTAGGAPRSVSVWYQQKKGEAGEPGTKWLSDLRAWWRKGGKSVKMPADGVSGATRAPGTHVIPLPADVKPGAYVLHVEAARETGGRELVSLPLTVSAKASGKTELGAISISAR